MSAGSDVSGATSAWLVHARLDLASARALLGIEEAGLYIPCFHAQQAGEKALKAVWTYREAEPPRTHDLERLRAGLGADLPALAALPSLESLSFWAVAGRYPGVSPSVTRTDAEAACKLAEQVLAAALTDLAALGFGEAEAARG